MLSLSCCSAIFTSMADCCKTGERLAASVCSNCSKSRLSSMASRFMSGTMSTSVSPSVLQSWWFAMLFWSSRCRLPSLSDSICSSYRVTSFFSAMPCFCLDLMSSISFEVSVMLLSYTLMPLLSFISSRYCPRAIKRIWLRVICTAFSLRCFCSSASRMPLFMAPPAYTTCCASSANELPKWGCENPLALVKSRSVMSTLPL